MKKGLLILATILATQTVFAANSALTVTAIQKDKKVVDGSGNPIAVDIISTATVNITGRQSNIEYLGAGLRVKSILKVKVYVGQLLGSDASKFQHTDVGALKSLGDMATVAMQMNFLRGVSANDIQTSFSEAATKNNLDLTLEHYQKFLAAVITGGEISAGTAVSVIGEKLNDGTEVITYQNDVSESVSISGPAGFVSGVMSMWLGLTADSGLTSLKKQIIGD